ncbi:DarT1-associated NADAR antitoxin family protein [Thiothrix winogradskyi]|uniref:Uncharacterized protein n=1 Tax=Thiothrix winogradskyi TaxID=96472 RepID=A0ABY3SWM4_9GAMM|nr:hypothetical protein [Thiothrix winogradskyi]UJS23034.1 hypothetical protein L2Y54_13915 [Thiothrix winogradskyi]
MATRPIFLPQKVGDLLVRTEFVDFVWSPGMAVTQKQKSISSLHAAAINNNLCTHPLEISSKSEIPLGVSLSAFNLKGSTRKRNQVFTVETLYQSSKVFERGGPYRDLLSASSRDAKKDDRIKESGRLIAFDLFGEKWPLEPKTAFYDWVYLNTLAKNDHLAEELGRYDAFTDIEFNPKKSINCQAYSVALFRALTMRSLIGDILGDRAAYFDIIGDRPVSNAVENTQSQSRLL